jgi:ATP-binding cassette subfamily B (MDR/TAP) protein 1
MTKKRLGTGATVSFRAKFLHPHHHRDGRFPDVSDDHRLTNAIVVRQEMKLINHVSTNCVIVHHDDFKNNDGRYHRLWCAVSHVHVDEEGDPDKFFEQQADDTAGSSTEKQLSGSTSNSDTDKTDPNNNKGKVDDEEEEEKIPDPLATTREVLSFVPNMKTKLYIVFGLFFASCSGVIFPALAWIFSGSFSDLSASTEASSDYMDAIRNLGFSFMVLGVVAFFFMTMQATLMELAATEMTREFKTKWFQALLRQDMAYYDLRDISGTATILSTNATRFKK